MKKLILMLVFLLAAFTENMLAQSGQNASRTLILPFAGRTAGIGAYYGPAVLLQNVGNSPVTIAGGKVFGRVNAEGLIVSNIPIISETLNLGIGVLNLNKLYFDTSYTREMADDEKVTQVSKGQGAGSFLNWRFFDEHIQLSQVLATWIMKFDHYLNSDRKEIQLPGIHLGDLNTLFFINNLTIDFTDDRSNPRSGWKGGLILNNARTSTEYSGTDTLSYSVNGYIPIGDHSTWVFRGFASDAAVATQATTSESRIRELLNVDCSGITTVSERAECEALEGALVQSLKSHNQLGTATPLGGSNMLRSFRQARFRAKHTAFVGSEIRWNKPDFIGGLQLQTALFTESGSAAETRSRLWKTSRSSYGVALRLIMDQLMIRLETATGEEGQEWFLTAGNPW